MSVRDPIGCSLRRAQTSANFSAKILTPERCAQAIGILERQQLNDRIPRLLPPEVKVAHKTGALPGLCHDAGILRWNSHQIIITTLTQAFPELPNVPLGADAATLIARISRIIYETTNQKEITSLL